jgi:hypothetical protein
MGRGEEANGSRFFPQTCAKEVETEHGWTKGNHRGYDVPLGGITEGASAPVAQSLRHLN